MYEETDGMIFKGLDPLTTKPLLILVNLRAPEWAARVSIPAPWD